MRIPFAPKPLSWLSLAVCLLLIHSPTLQGQDATDNRSLKISGGLRLSNDFYTSNGIDPRRDALQWRAVANLNLNFAGVSAPFSLAFSDGNQEFNLPSYTFVGISPTYKWATLHLGDRSINYSKYTLSGINFRGAGFELRPNNFYVSGMYGQLRRARAEDLNSQQMLDPSYRRMGYGMKMGYRGKGSEYSVIVFGAEDDEASIGQPVTSAITPANNAIISGIVKQKLGKRLSADLELAHSVYNADRRAEDLTDADTDFGNRIFGLFTPNETAIDGNAYRAKLNYGLKGMNLQGGYERIERGFRTLGALFFLSDAEYYTAGFSKTFLKNKMTFFANGGLERTNLDDFEKNGTRRLVGSLNLSYIPNEKWLFNTSYSNFENTTRLKTFDPSAIVDSLILAQTTQAGNAVATYNISSRENPSSLTLVLSYQQANSIVDDVIQDDAKSQFFNGSLMYSKTQSLQDLRFTAALNYNQTELSMLNNSTISPTIGITKGFYERKLQTTFRSTYNLISSQNRGNSNVLNLTLGATYLYQEDHSFSFSTSFINRTGGGQEFPSFSEWYGRLAYGYRFGGNLRLY